MPPFAIGSPCLRPLTVGGPSLRAAHTWGPRRWPAKRTAAGHRRWCRRSGARPPPVAAGIRRRTARHLASVNPPITRWSADGKG